MTTIELLSIFAVLHFSQWCSDFLAQSRQVAEAKSKQTFALVYHVLVQTMLMVPAFALLAYVASSPANEFMFILAMAMYMNAASHFLIDTTTSRLASFFHTKGKTKVFFDTIGFEQMLHHLTYVMIIYVILAKF